MKDYGKDLVEKCRVLGIPPEKTVEYLCSKYNQLMELFQLVLAQQVGTHTVIEEKKDK